jgi:hypothetical protein
VSRVRFAPWAPFECFKKSEKVQITRSLSRFAGFLLSGEIRRNPLQFTHVMGKIMGKSWMGKSLYPYEGNSSIILDKNNKVDSLWQGLGKTCCLI